MPGNIPLIEGGVHVPSRARGGSEGGLTHPNQPSTPSEATYPSMSIRNLTAERPYSHSGEAEQPFPLGDPTSQYQTSATGGTPSPEPSGLHYTPVDAAVTHPTADVLGPQSTSQHADTPSASSPMKESMSEVKGLVAAVPGAGEDIRGNFNAGVDRAFADVCIPPSPLFPHLGALQDFECDEEKVGAVWQDGSVRYDDSGSITNRTISQGDRKGQEKHGILK